MMEKFGSQRSYTNIEFESYAELGLVALEWLLLTWCILKPPPQSLSRDVRIYHLLAVSFKCSFKENIKTRWMFIPVFLRIAIDTKKQITEYWEKTKWNKRVNHLSGNNSGAETFLLIFLVDF